MKYKTDDLAQALLDSRINESADGLGPAVKVLQSGKVKVGKAFKVKEFNDDDGWVTTTIKPGEYEFRLLDFRGWKPRQIKVNNAWVDVQNLCQEIEGLIHEGVTKEKFLDYVRIQYSGVTNMHDVRTVCDLSTEGLTKDDCLDIMKNYSDYKKKWCKNC